MDPKTDPRKVLGRSQLDIGSDLLVEQNEV